MCTWRWPEAGGDSGVWLLMAKPGGSMPLCLEAQLLSDSAGDTVQRYEYDVYGQVPGAAITMRYKYTEQAIAADRKLRQVADKLRKRIMTI